MPLPSDVLGGLAVICSCFVFPHAARAELVTYPGPDGIVPSDQYAVKVTQDGRTRDSFVYLTRAQWKTNRSKTTSWTMFSFSGKVTVEVTKRQGDFRTCRVIPSSYGIKAVTKGRTVVFELDRPRKVSVEFDGDTTHPMLVFADALELGIPAKDDPNVVHFGPGVHDVGLKYAIKPNTTVYLAGGAYVKGTFLAMDGSNVRICGRGILSGEQFDGKTHHLLNFTDWKSRGGTIEGVTLVNAPHYNILLAGTGHTVRNVKMISWWFSTDGVGMGPDGTVEDCFFKVNDDAVKLYHSNMRVRDCVIWQMENGAPFQISWNMPSDNSDFHVRNVDVIRVEHKWNNDNEAVFNAIHGGQGYMHKYLFEDIRIENADWRLFHLLLKKTEWAKGPEWGRISDITFRNITADGPFQKPSTIKGHDAQHGISNVTFENVKVNGQYLTRPEDGPFEIDPATTANIRFAATAKNDNDR